LSLLIVPLLLLAESGLATPPPPVVSGETTAGHPAVGALVVCSGDRCASFCSGTLVDERWVVTAGHCVEAMEDDYRNLDVRFAVGEDVRWGGEADAMDEVEDGLVHPHYGDMDHDIGLVQLANGIDGVTQRVSMSAPRDSWLGTSLRYVGYGVTSDEADDAGVKRRTDIPLVDWDEQWLMAEDPEGETNLCWGDSGGAALMPLEGGGYALVGVQSWVWDDDSTPCTGGSSGAARVDAHIDWLADKAPMDIVVIEESEDEDPVEEPEEEQEQTGGDDEEGQDSEDEDEDDTGWADDEEDEGGSIPSNDPELDVGGNSAASFQRASTGCTTAPSRGLPLLPALLAVMAGLTLGRRRN